ncbi:hypothetical protein LINGRAHAP2_LOCUS17241 [Linum grandiflorum]
MAASGLPALGRVKLSDLVATEGLPSDSYKLSVSTLSQSLAQYSAAIIQFSATDGALLRSGLDSARLYFHQRPFPTSTEEVIQGDDSREWCRTSGYYANPHLWQETYDYRPGLTPTDPTNIMEFPPGEILDNVPLRSREISSSVLSVCCHARPSFQGALAQHHSLTAQEDGQMGMYLDHDHQVDKSLLSLVKSDKAGLHIRDFNGRWVLVDGDLGPQEAIVFPGLALYQATAGYVNPALHRTEISSMESNIDESSRSWR